MTLSRWLIGSLMFLTAAAQVHAEGKPRPVTSCPAACTPRSCCENSPTQDLSQFSYSDLACDFLEAWWTLCGQGKYQEAGKMAELACALDPTDDTARKAVRLTDLIAVLKDCWLSQDACCPVSGPTCVGNQGLTGCPSVCFGDAGKKHPGSSSSVTSCPKASCGPVQALCGGSAKGQAGGAGGSAGPKGVSISFSGGVTPFLKQWILTTTKLMKKCNTSCCGKECSCCGNCDCCKKNTCACGEKCQCKKTEVKTVQCPLGFTPGMHPPMHPPGPWMMPPHFIMVPSPASGPMWPHTPVMMPPCMPDCSAVAFPHMVAHPQPPEMVAPPRVALHRATPVIHQASSQTSTRPVMKVSATGNHVHLVLPWLEAHCEKLTGLGCGEKVILEGNVRITVRPKAGPAACIQSQRVELNLRDGTFGVFGVRLEAGSDACPLQVTCPPTPRTPVSAVTPHMSRSSAVQPAAFIVDSVCDTIVKPVVQPILRTISFGCERTAPCSRNVDPRDR